MPTAAPSQDERTSGSEPTSPTFGPEQLRQKERSSVGQPTPETTPAGKTADPRGDYNPQKTPLGDSSDPRGALSAAESSSSGYENQVGNGFTAEAGELASLGFRGRLKWLGKNRKAVWGGGIIGTIVGIIFFFTLASGPLQFIHFAQLLQQFHLTSQSNSEDGRFLKEVRFAKYAKSGNLERTRLNYFANNWADGYEAKLESAGFKSAYSPIFQNYDGYVLDEAQFKNPDGSQMSDQEIKDSVKAKYGVDVVDGSTIAHNPNLDGHLVINARDLSPLQNIKLTNNLLQDVGLSKISAANGLRLLVARYGVTFHPLKNLITKGETKAEIAKAATQSEETVIDEGTNVPATATDTAEADSTKTDAEKSAAGEATADANAVINDGKNIDSGGSSSGLLKGSLNAGLAYGAACVANSINNHAGELKQTQVIGPLIRMAMWVISTGSQIESGQGVDLNTLGVYSQQLSGIDSSGKDSSVIDSPSIQSNLGNPNAGTIQDPTLQNIGSNSKPFPWLDIPGISSALNVACSPAVGFLALGVSFLGGEFEEAATQAINGYLQQTAISYALERWAGGKAINALAVGKDRGNDADVGTVLAANDDAIAHGGTALSASDQATLNYQNATQAQQQFDSHNIAYKLFDLQDEHSAIAKVIDNASSSPTQNIAKVGSAFLNVGHIFSSVTSLFSPKAHAATSSGYNYGIPIYGFSSADLNNATYENPYQNACYVVGGCTDPDTGQSISSFMVDPSTNQPTTTGNLYMQKATACFGVNIAADASGNWGVTSASSSAPQLYNASGNGHYPSDCSDPANLDQTDWQRLRFFILDTETSESMGCYAGDTEACTNIGYDATGGGGAATTPTTTSVGSTTPTTPTSSSGYQDPLRDIEKSGSLTAERIDQGVDYSGSGPVYALGNAQITLAEGPNVGWETEGYWISYKLTDGPAQGKYVYVAEDCVPAVKTGDVVSANTVICNMFKGPSGIETGWADDPSAGNIAAAHDAWGKDVDSTGDYTAYGLNFSQLLNSLGTPSGIIGAGGQELGSLPSGWPTW